MLFREARIVPIPRVRCANCGAIFDIGDHDTPYCSLRCHDEAKAVRYARKKLIEYPAGLPDDIDMAIRMKIAHALAGGYDENQRHLTPEQRDAVWERDGGNCMLCGAPGEEIDHIDGPSNDPGNLQLLCDRCHNDKTRARLVPIEDPEERARYEELETRILAPEPLLPCDASDWDGSWRKWRNSNLVTTDN